MISGKRDRERKALPSSSVLGRLSHSEPSGGGGVEEETPSPWEKVDHGNDKLEKDVPSIITTTLVDAWRLFFGTRWTDGLKYVCIE